VDEFLKHLDGLLTLEVFATLAGLSITVAAFLTSAMETAKPHILGPYGTEGLGQASRGLFPEGDAEELKRTLFQSYFSLKSGRNYAVWSFYCFVGALTAVTGFDSVNRSSLSWEIPNAALAGGPFAVGMFYLSWTAKSILTTNT
jgi:hypothetical protein